MKLTKRKGFNFFRSYYDVYNELSNKDKVLFMDALLDRQFLGIKPDLPKGMANFAYLSQTNSIDSQVKGYEDKTKTKLNSTPTEGGADGGADTPTLQVQGKEKEKEQPICGKQQIENFLNWFNESKKTQLGKKGLSKTLTDTDINNLKKLRKVYGQEEFNIAFKNLCKSEWALEKKMIIPAHFLRNDNFDKYLNQDGGDIIKKATHSNPAN